MHTKTALVIGATGLIGGHLTETLLGDSSWDRVRLLVRRPITMTHPKLEVVVIDSCGYAADTSNVSRTIHLAINTIQQLKIHQLAWNDYEGFSGAPTVFNVWRRLDGVIEGLPTSVYPPATGNHLDDVSGLLNSNGQFSYFIEALEGAGNIYGLTGVLSLSNEVQALMEPNIFIPSAFTPQGEQNTIFKPVAVFVPEGNYNFSVFNRFGQMIFATTDREKGWDGTFKGEFVPEGVYVYVVRFVSAANKDYERRGTVTVLR
jgi:gliding motility-associated-like protein